MGKGEKISSLTIKTVRNHCDITIIAYQTLKKNITKFCKKLSFLEFLFDEEHEEHYTFIVSSA